MKKDKDKQKKTHESTIGKIIYAFLLFLPLLAIGVTCGYAMFNKNAYKSYSNFNENNTHYVNIDSFNSLEVGQTYRFISSNIQNPNLKTSASGEMRIDNISIINSSVDTSSWDLSKINGFYVWNYTTLTYLRFTTEDNSLNSNYNLMNNFFEFSFEYVGLTNINQNYNFEYSFDNYIYKDILLNQTNTIDNVFYYSIDKVQQSPLFNWAENSIIYTGMTEFTTSLDIATPFIPLLLTYWLIISLVYFIYDIVLIIFNVLHRKIHELQDSI